MRLRYAIVAYDAHSRQWWARHARPPASERAWLEGRLDPDSENETLAVPGLGCRPLPAGTVWAAQPTHRQAREIRGALGLRNKRGVEFYARFEEGNPNYQEGWEIRWPEEGKSV